jgi:excisionase family DNA binding protein
MNVVKLNYSVEEAAEALGIGITLCKQLIADGSIPSHKYGGRRLIPARDLEAANDQHAATWREQDRSITRRAS